MPQFSFSKYHPGKYLVAWHPKASEENERTTVVVDNKNFGRIVIAKVIEFLATYPHIFFVKVLEWEKLLSE